MGKSNKIFISSKSVTVLTVLTILLTTIAVWLWGIERHQTIFRNSMLSVSILSIAFFLFIAIGLYKGVKLKEDVGKITNHITLKKMPALNDLWIDGDLTIGDGLGGILLGILLWIVATIVIALLIWILGVFLWSGILILAAMIYWILFRALRLVFKNTKTCQGRMGKSVGLAFFYTALYNCWIYGIILMAHFLR